MAEQIASKTYEQSPSRKRTISEQADESEVPQKQTKNNKGNAVATPTDKVNQFPSSSPALQAGPNKTPNRLTLVNLRAEMGVLNENIKQCMDSTFQDILHELREFKSSIASTVHDEVAKLTAKFEADVTSLHERVDVMDPTVVAKCLRKQF